MIQRLRPGVKEEFSIVEVAGLLVGVFQLYRVEVEGILRLQAALMASVILFQEA